MATSSAWAWSTAFSYPPKRTPVSSEPTADLLMEFDEAQDIDQDKHDKEFVPMTASTNAPRVYYGTAWDDSTLLERIKQNHLEMTKYDGHPRHFEYNCWRVAEEVPKYGEFVEKEKARLGESHPIFQTQYLLKTISGAGRFLTNDQLALMRGVHPREDGRTHGYYVAGIDVAGADEETQDAALRRLKPRKDSTVMTVARVTFGAIAEISEPLVEVVAHYWWTGRSHRTQYERLLHLLRVRWHVQFAVVDATGVGAGLASFLAEALGESVIEQFAFTGPLQIRYRLRAAIRGQRRPGCPSTTVPTRTPRHMTSSSRSADFANTRSRASNKCRSTSPNPTATMILFRRWHSAPEPPPHSNHQASWPLSKDRQPNKADSRRPRC